MRLDLLLAIDDIGLCAENHEGIRHAADIGGCLLDRGAQLGKAEGRGGTDLAGLAINRDSAVEVGAPSHANRGDGTSDGA